MTKKSNLQQTQIEHLIKRALEVRDRAYVPYSKFRVGAALLTAEDQIFTGCNVENASYGLTNCAERTAIFKAVSEGSRNFKAIAIVADTENYCSPCGACRQVLAEFGPEIEVIMANHKGEYVIKTGSDLLPGFFNANELP